MFWEEKGLVCVKYEAVFVFVCVNLYVQCRSVDLASYACLCIFTDL